MSVGPPLPASGLVSRCPCWYELNLHALSFKEMKRATDSALQAVLGFAFFRLLGGVASGPAILVPEEITVVETVDITGLELPSELADMGFTLAQAFHLPEFTGDNLTCCFIDRHGTSTCDVVFARVNDQFQSEAIFYSHFGGQPIRSIKSIGSWRADPLERPAEKPVRCVPGDLRTRYEAHRQWLASEPGTPQRLTWETVLAMSHDSHRELVQHYLARGVYRPAPLPHVTALLRRKRLGWSPRA